MRHPAIPTLPQQAKRVNLIRNDSPREYYVNNKTGLLSLIPPTRPAPQAQLMRRAQSYQLSDTAYQSTNPKQGRTRRDLPGEAKQRPRPYFVSAADGCCCRDLGGGG
jgi:hypothetical protein